MKFSEKGISRTTGILITVVVLLVIANMATIYYFYAKNEKAEQASQVVKENSQEVAIDTDEDGISDEQEKALGTDPKQFDTDGDGYSDGEEVASGHDPLVSQAINAVAENQIVVSWNEWPVSENLAWYYNVNELDSVAKKHKDEFFVDSEKMNGEELIKVFTIFQVGTVNNGIYKNSKVYLIYRNKDTIDSSLYRAIQKNGKLVILSKMSSSTLPDYMTEIFSVDSQTSIANLETPDNINIPGSDMKLIKEKNEKYVIFSDVEAEKLFSVAKGELFRDKNSNCLFMKAPDGSLRYYYYDIFIDRSEKYELPKLAELKWNDGSISENEYIAEAGKCNMSCFTKLSSLSNDQVTEVGEIVKNQAVYKLKDVNYKVEGDEKTYIQNMYEMSFGGEQAGKISLDDFIKDNPLLLWKDPFGQYFLFRNNKYMPMAECGKPVIYLYPEKTTDVSVQVAPTGGFTITEPAYNNGWKVKATPDSELYNYADKQTYPYLFWEGHGYNYQMPNVGFVVKKEEVEKFLVEKLAKLGLIKKEYDEFIEFWLPKMQEKPYYFVTFVPQNDFDKIAPLSVNPKPDTIIRVFMDFQGLDNFVRVPEQKIVTPIRKGFTVVEWGGALHN